MLVVAYFEGDVAGILGMNDLTPGLYLLFLSSHIVG